MEPAADPTAIEYLTDVYLRGKPCPHCGHVRARDKPGPRWHCPNCHNPYPDLLPPLDADSQAKDPVFDASTVVLIVANVVTIGSALWFELSLKDLMLVYWLQSVMIGISFLIRMTVRTRATGDSFSWHPAGMPVFLKPVFFLLQGKYFNPIFFTMHYGFFHLGYLIFLKPSTTLGLFSGFGLCVLVFALSHAHSLWYNIRRDRAAGVDASVLFWLPYARIVPMHTTLVLGPQLAGGAYSLVLFLGLKTLADVLMHVVEHRVLRR